MTMEPKARTRAREAVVQALYAWQVNHQAIDALVQQHLPVEGDASPADVDYYQQCLRGALEHLEQVDQIISQYSSRSVDKLDGVECAILRLSVYELLYRLECPFRVVINEALEITKAFGSVDGYKFINGVLDKVASQHRQSVEQ